MRDQHHIAVDSSRVSTHRHPEVVSLFVRSGELNLSSRGGNHDTLVEQASGLDVRVVNSSHARDEHYHEISAQ